METQILYREEAYVPRILVSQFKSHALDKAALVEAQVRECIAAMRHEEAQSMLDQLVFFTELAKQAEVVVGLALAAEDSLVS